MTTTIESMLIPPGICEECKTLTEVYTQKYKPNDDGTWPWLYAHKEVKIPDYATSTTTYAYNPYNYSIFGWGKNKKQLSTTTKTASCTISSYSFIIANSGNSVKNFFINNWNANYRAILELKKGYNKAIEEIPIPYIPSHTTPQQHSPSIPYFLFPDMHLPLDTSYRFSIRVETTDGSVLSSPFPELHYDETHFPKEFPIQKACKVILFGKEVFLI